jgi:hypothetical protein
MKKIQLLVTFTLLLLLSACMVDSDTNDTQSLSMDRPIQTANYIGYPSSQSSRLGVVKLTTLFSSNSQYNGKVGNCSGTMIGPDIILTAAHCFNSPTVSHSSIYGDNKISHDEIRFMTIVYDDPRTNNKSVAMYDEGEVEVYLNPDNNPTSNEWKNDVAIIHKRSGSFISTMSARDNFNFIASNYYGTFTEVEHELVGYGYNNNWRRDDQVEFYNAELDAHINDPSSSIYWELEGNTSYLTQHYGNIPGSTEHKSIRITPNEITHNGTEHFTTKSAHAVACSGDSGGPAFYSDLSIPKWNKGIISGINSYVTQISGDCGVNGGASLKSTQATDIEEWVKTKVDAINTSAPCTYTTRYGVKVLKCWN